MGEITGETLITNCKDGTSTPLKDIPEFQNHPKEEDHSHPVRTSIRFNLQQRIRELEEALLDERRAREDAENQIHRLETKLADITRAAAR
jgi:hypothetical protein